MPTLIIIALVVALVWLGHRYWRLRQAVHLLADAIGRRSSFLHEDEELPKLHPAWRKLVAECGAMLRELAGLKARGVGQLNQLQTTLGSLREGVLMVDGSNYVLLANPALSRIFPAIRHAVGQRLEVVLHSIEFLDLLDGVRRSGESMQREIEFREQGRSVWIEATGALIVEPKEEGGPWCLFVLHDITRQKELEAVRKEFVANVSHELKTPIAMLKGYAETLADDDGSMPVADRVQFARTIQRHADRLSAIVDDLLTLSRLEAGGAVLQASWQDLAAIVRATAEEFRDAFAASGHALTVVGVSEPQPALVDSLRMNQVLTNLLQNAQKYTPRGSRVEVGIRALQESDDVEVWVSDDGPGIPPADLPRIFERFYRVEKGRSRETGGTGLGLSIVKHIVHLHGGHVNAESRVGQGTRMSFRLPAGLPARLAPRGEFRREEPSVSGLRT